MKENWTVKDTLLIVKIAVIIMIITIIIFTNFISITQVQGESMMPNVKNGEYLLLDIFTYKITDSINRYDVITFKPECEEDYYIKRVIGLPGETIDIVPSKYDKDGNLIKRSRIYINGKELVDDVYYLKDGEDYNLDDIHMTLAEDEYFVLGDNRNDSHDSRSEDVSAVSYDSIDGIVINKR